MAANKIKLLPEAVDVHYFDPSKYQKIDFKTLGVSINENSFIFFSIFKWEERKAWKILLNAFVQEFKIEGGQLYFLFIFLFYFYVILIDEVSLVILTHGYHDQHDPSPRLQIEHYLTQQGLLLFSCFSLAFPLLL